MHKYNGMSLLKTKINLLLKKCYACGVTPPSMTCPIRNLRSDHPVSLLSVTFIAAPLCHPQNANGKSRQHAETHGNVNRKIETLRIKSK